jgi:hypothetical protein
VLVAVAGLFRRAFLWPRLHLSIELNLNNISTTINISDRLNSSFGEQFCCREFSLLL